MQHIFVLIINDMLPCLYYSDLLCNTDRRHIFGTYAAIEDIKTLLFKCKFNTCDYGFLTKALLPIRILKNISQFDLFFSVDHILLRQRQNSRSDPSCNGLVAC